MTGAPGLPWALLICSIAGAVLAARGRLRDMPTGRSLEHGLIGADEARESTQAPPEGDVTTADDEGWHPTPLNEKKVNYDVPGGRLESAPDSLPSIGLGSQALFFLIVMLLSTLIIVYVAHPVPWSQVINELAPPDPHFPPAYVSPGLYVIPPLYVIALGVDILAAACLLWLLKVMLTRRNELHGPKNRLVGEARAFQSRNEQVAFVNVTVWSFRVDRFDCRSGNRLPPVPVEMRGLRFDGSISEGDHIEVYVRSEGRQTVAARWVKNLSTGTLVEARELADRLPVVVFGAGSLLVGLAGLMLSIMK